MFLLGHSMGGCISVKYAISHQDRLRGLLLSGPLAALDAAPPPVRVLASILSALMPKLPLFAVDASLVSRDPAVVKAYEDDPLVYHGKLPVRTVSELAGGDRFVPRHGRRDHDPDADHVRHGRQAGPAGGKRDARRADRRRRQDRDPVPGPLPRDPERARAEPGDGRHVRVAERARRRPRRLRPSPRQRCDGRRRAR